MSPELEKTSAYLQYLVDRGTHWFPRVNFLIGRFPQQRLNRRDEIHYLSSLFRDMPVPAGRAGFEALDDGFDRSREQDDAINQREKSIHVLSAPTDEQRPFFRARKEVADAVLPPHPILPLNRCQTI
jgi:hypothetical protein